MVPSTGTLLGDQFGPGGRAGDMWRPAAVLWFCAILNPTSAILRCAQVERQSSPVFQLVRRCSRSAMTVLTHSNVTSVRRCADLAYSRRGLALNFSPRSARRSDPSSSSCEVLQCPEFQGLGSLQRDEGYDYYSLYVDPTPNANWTCVPGVGMFGVYAGTRRTNFTLAAQRCRDDFGDLAHVLSEARTAGLSSLLNSTRGNIRRAFVNLSDRKSEGLFVTSADEPLPCFPYRAWGPGEPRNKSKEDDCVVLDWGRTWAVTGCAKRLPFICELYPSDPNAGSCSQADGDSSELCAELRWMKELQGTEADRCEGWELLATPTTTVTSTTSSTTAAPPEDGDEEQDEDAEDEDEEDDEEEEDQDEGVQNPAEGVEEDLDKDDGVGEQARR